MRARATAVALLLPVGGVAACGGDDDGGGEQSKEALCDINAQID